MPFVSSGRPSATDDFVQILYSRHVGWCTGTTPLGNIEVFEGLASGSDVSMTVELETPFLFVVPLVEGE